jgi:hypothetical protein
LSMWQLLIFCSRCSLKNQTCYSFQAEFRSDSYEARTDGILQHRNMLQHQKTGNIQAIVEAKRKDRKLKQIKYECKNPQRWLPGL